MTSYSGIIEGVYDSIATQHGTEQRLLLRNVGGSGKTLILLRNMPRSLEFHVGQPMTVRGEYLSQTREDLSTLCPTLGSKGFVRYNGQVVSWFCQAVRPTKVAQH